MSRLDAGARGARRARRGRHGGAPSRPASRRTPGRPVFDAAPALAWRTVARAALALTFVLGVATPAARGEAPGTTVVWVDSTRTGGFGSPNTCFQPFVEAIALAAGDQVAVSATGRVVLAGAFGSRPDGVAIGPGEFESDLFPLEEASSDAGGPPVDPVDASERVGALIGAFVPEASAAALEFEPVDEDLIGTPSQPERPRGHPAATAAIPASTLFVVGAGPACFTAPEAGRLYLGINDTLACNNRGRFEVTLEPGPCEAPCVGPGAVAGDESTAPPTEGRCPGPIRRRRRD